MKYSLTIIFTLFTIITFCQDTVSSRQLKYNYAIKNIRGDSVNFFQLNNLPFTGISADTFRNQSKLIDTIKINGKDSAITRYNKITVRYITYKNGYVDGITKMYAADFDVIISESLVQNHVTVYFKGFHQRNGKLWDLNIYDKNGNTKYRKQYSENGGLIYKCIFKKKRTKVIRWSCNDRKSTDNKTVKTIMVHTKDKVIREKQKIVKSTSKHCT